MNEEYSLNAFCDKIKARLGAGECLSFSGRLESIVALFDIIQLGARDCVYVSAAAPRDIVGAIIMCGAVPVFCDVTPDTLTIDPKALEGLVNRTINEGKFYPRAVIADNFCGMPFAAGPINRICDHMGLLLVEDCGECFGGSSDYGACGSIGDYSLISLGGGTVFGTGGRGALLIANGENEAEEFIVSEQCGCMYQTVDEIYHEQLNASVDMIDSRVEACRSYVKQLESLISNCGCWIQRGGNRLKSSYCKAVIIAQDKEHCTELFEKLKLSGLARYASYMHIHTRNCFESNCRGLKDIVNGAAISQKALMLDILLAIKDSKTDDISALFSKNAQ